MGTELERQAEAMEGYFETVVETLTRAGYRWYETANFCLDSERSAGRDLRGQHNLAYWRGRDYLGVGIGAVSTVSGIRTRNLPGLGGYIAALASGERPRREVEMLDEDTRARERLMLGLRLDEPVRVADVDGSVDAAALRRLTITGLVELSSNGTGDELRLTNRGRFLGGGVTAELMTQPRN